MFGISFCLRYCRKKDKKAINSTTINLEEQTDQALSKEKRCPVGQGNLLKGIVIWFVRREGIESIKRASSLLLFSVTRFL